MDQTLRSPKSNQLDRPKETFMKQLDYCQSLAAVGIVSAMAVTTVPAAANGLVSVALLVIRPAY